VDNPPQKQTEPSKEFQAFEELARKLVSVPKAEADKKRAAKTKRKKKK